MIATEKHELPFLHIYYRKDLSILFSRWSAHVAHQQLVEGYSSSLQFAQENDAHFWLIDVRLRNVPDSLSLDWLQNNFSFTLRSALGSTTFIAYLLSPLQLEQMPIKQKEGVPVVVDSQLIYCFFLTETNAINWLNRARQLSTS